MPAQTYASSVITERAIKHRHWATCFWWHAIADLQFKLVGGPEVRCRSCRNREMSSVLPTTHYLLPATYYLPTSTDYLLPIAHYPTTHYLLLLLLLHSTALVHGSCTMASLLATRHEPRTSVVQCNVVMGRVGERKHRVWTKNTKYQHFESGAHIKLWIAKHIDKSNNKLINLFVFLIHI